MSARSEHLVAWLTALQQRHRAALTSTEFLKAVRALSARYVERRSQLRDRSPLDSAGKRAAFAAFYAPLHLITVQEIVRALTAGLKIGDSEERRRFEEPSRSEQRRSRPSGRLTSIVDLGSGTGVASAAWALAQARPPALVGVDANSWALGEGQWNWRQLGLVGESRRSDLVNEAERLMSRRRPSFAESGFIAGWSVNELDHRKRQRLLEALIALANAGAALLVIEPMARSAVPWWDEWAAAFAAIGGRADEWRFDVDLPSVLAELDEAAGFRRRDLAARSLAAGL